MPYLIATAEQLNRVGSNPSYLNQSFALCADIDLSAYDGSSPAHTFNEIGTADWQAGTSVPFTGTFEGHSHTVNHLILNNAMNSSTTGLFGQTSGASISGINLTNVLVTGVHQTAGLIGASQNTSVSNCSVSGQVTVAADGTNHGSIAGGLIGKFISSTSNGSVSVLNSHSNLTIAGGDTVGGLIGAVAIINGGSAVVSNCSSAGVVNSDVISALGGNTIGGLIGYAGQTDTSVTNFSVNYSNSSAQVTSGGAFSGGFIGTLMNSGGAGSTTSVTQCFSTGNFLTTGNTSDLSFFHGAFSGGLVGIATVAVGNQTTFDQTYVTGSTSVSDPQGGSGFGGLVGGFGADGSVSVSNSYVTGRVFMVGSTIPAGLSSGGLVGQWRTGNSSVSILSHSYADQTVSDGETGALIGQIVGLSPQIVSSYWNSDVFSSGLPGGNANAVGLNTVQMKSASFFSGWNFSSVWQIVEGVSPPTLQFIHN